MIFAESNKIRDYLNKTLENITILGPSPGAIPKVYNKYNMQIILKYKNLSQIYNELKFIQDKNKTNNKITLDIDFNPRKI